MCGWVCVLGGGVGCVVRGGVRLGVWLGAWLGVRLGVLLGVCWMEGLGVWLGG